MKAVFLKEMRSYFRNPLGYVFVGMMLMIMGFYYVFYTIYYQYADYYHVLNASSSLILFVIPILTMRILSEEKKNRTDQILLTSPISTGGIVIGKFLAATCIFAIVILISFIQPLVTVTVFKGTMQTGMLFGGYIAFLLLGMAFISIGMFISSLTENQLISAVVTIGTFSILFLTEGIYSIFPTSRYIALAILVVLLLLVLFFIYRSIHDVMVTGIVGAIGLLAMVVAFFLAPTAFDGLINRMLQSISIFMRYADMFSGVFSFSHITFFLSVTAFFLFLTYQVIERKRWS